MAENFGEMQILTNAPWSLEEALSWSKREIIVYTDGHTVTGLRIDGHLPAAAQASLDSWEWTSTKIDNKTLLTPAHLAVSNDIERHLNFWLLLPQFDGTITLKTGGKTKTLPYNISRQGYVDLPLDMSAFVPTSHLALETDTEIIASVVLPPDTVNTFIPNNPSANFPGLIKLENAVEGQHLEILLGKDTQGLAFIAASTTTTLSLEDLATIADEMVSLQNLSTTALTIENFPDSQELRSAEPVIDINNANGINAVIASTQQGQTFRLTQSDTQLIFSNRPTLISPILAKNTSTCLPRASGILKPKQLTELGYGEAANNNLMSYILRIDEVAFRNTKLRICW